MNTETALAVKSSEVPFISIRFAIDQKLEFKPKKTAIQNDGFTNYRSRSFSPGYSSSNLSVCFATRQTRAAKHTTKIVIINNAVCNVLITPPNLAGFPIVHNCGSHTATFTKGNPMDEQNTMLRALVDAYLQLACALHEADVLPLQDLRQRFEASLDNAHASWQQLPNPYSRLLVEQLRAREDVYKKSRNK